MKFFALKTEPLHPYLTHYSCADMYEGMPAFYDDFRYLYFDEEDFVEAQSLSEVPEHVENFAKIADAVSHIQKCGMTGRDIHSAGNEWHELCVQILTEVLIPEYGEVHPVVFQGIRGEIEGRRLHFSTPDRDVAEFYTDSRAIVLRHENLFGVWYRGSGPSVVTADYGYSDIEIIST